MELRIGEGRPLQAVWLTNATGLTLDGGSMTLIDADAFAGEGLLEALKPGEKRLLSYAADLGVLVDARRDPWSGRTFRLRAREGISNTIVQDQQRLRENMKALRGSAEEQQLLQRYTRQLDQQETRLEKLETELAQVATQIQRVQGELGRLIASISFDLTTP